MGASSRQKDVGEAIGLVQAARVILTEPPRPSFVLDKGLTGYPASIAPILVGRLVRMELSDGTSGWGVYVKGDRDRLVARWVESDAEREARRRQEAANHDIEGWLPGDPEP